MYTPSVSLVCSPGLLNGGPGLRPERGQKGAASSPLVWEGARGQLPTRLGCRGQVKGMATFRGTPESFLPPIARPGSCPECFLVPNHSLSCPAFWGENQTPPPPPAANHPWVCAQAGGVALENSCEGQAGDTGDQPQVTLQAPPCCGWCVSHQPPK